MMLNADVDGCTETLNHWKIIWNTQKNILKAKRILKPKYERGGGPVFTSSLPGLVIYETACKSSN